MKKLPQPHYHIHLRYSKVSGILVTVKADKQCMLPRILEKRDHKLVFGQDTFVRLLSA